MQSRVLQELAGQYLNPNTFYMGDHRWEMEHPGLLIVVSRREGTLKVELHPRENATLPMRKGDKAAKLRVKDLLGHQKALPSFHHDDASDFWFAYTDKAVNTFTIQLELVLP